MTVKHEMIMIRAIITFLICISILFNTKMEHEYMSHKLDAKQMFIINIRRYNENSIVTNQYLQENNLLTDATKPLL